MTTAAVQLETAALDQLAERAWERMLERSPYLRVRQGLPVTWIPSGSPAEIDEDAGFAREQLRQLSAIDLATLDPQRRITAGVLRHIYEQSIDLVENQWYMFAVTPYASYGLTLYLEHVFLPFRFDSAEDCERYLQLLHDLARMVLQLENHTEEQDRRGIRIPSVALAGARAAIAGQRARAETSLRVAAERVAPAASGIGARIDQLVDGEVLQAFDRVLELLNGPYAERVSETVGLAQYPGGEEAYRRLVRRHATFDVSPEQIHETGLEQVAALAQEMADVRRRLGFDGTEEEFHASLASTPRLFAKTPEEVERRYLDYMARLEPRLPEYFRILPRAPYGVARLDPALEAGMTYGYYEPPTPERPVGRYRYNASNLEQRSLLTAGAIIYHELAPGHHFHIARQSENESLPMVRREPLDFTAYTEGWAEYASGLSREMGLLDDWELYGRLVHERFTAQRLVLDTGMNLFGWHLDRARQYMRDNTLESDVQIGTETLRYSTDLPGQALAYRIGFLKLMELRRKAQEALGDGFDIRDFHEEVLGGGAMPFDALEQHLTAWVTDQR